MTGYLHQRFQVNLMYAFSEKYFLKIQKILISNALHTFKYIERNVEIASLNSKSYSIPL